MSEKPAAPMLPKRGSAPAANPPPKIRGTPGPETEVKIVPPEQVKVRGAKPSAAPAAV